jgi:hypothetical protein
VNPKRLRIPAFAVFEQESCLPENSQEWWFLHFKDEIIFSSNRVKSSHRFGYLFNELDP